MTTPAAVLQRLQQRASQADQIIAQLRVQLNLLRGNSDVNSCQAEENSLKTENAKLRQDIKHMKELLVIQENKNGVKQVSLPKAGAVPSRPAVPHISYVPATYEAAAAAAPVIPVATAVTPGGEQQDNKSKQKKKEKKAEGKKEEKPAAAAAPVDVSRLDMRIGYINSAKKHPDADGLYVEEVDLGEGKCRTIVSGLVKHVPLEQMQNRHAIFICNLKSAKMRGILSEGMIMCASTPEKVEIINPPEGVVKGERIIVDGYPGTPDTLLNPKKKIWEQVQPDLLIDAEGKATYKGTPWQIADKGFCTVPTMRKTGIK